MQYLDSSLNGAPVVAVIGCSSVQVDRQVPYVKRSTRRRPDEGYARRKRDGLELSWLFNELGAAFRPVLDHVTKLEFFGRLAKAAIAYHEQAGDSAHVQGLLEAVLY